MEDKQSIDKRAGNMMIREWILTRIYSELYQAKALIIP